MTGIAAPSGTTTVGAVEPAARFRDLIAAEWIKLWSLRSTPWVYGLSALFIIAINANAANADMTNWSSYSAQTRATFAPHASLRDAFTLDAAYILMLAAGSIGAVMIVNEYGTGLIRTTFAAVPARRSVMIAKIVVLTGFMTLGGALIAAGSFWATQAILSEHLVGLSSTDPGVLRDIAVTTLIAPVSALIGMGIGTLVRHTATTIVGTIAVLLLLPILIYSNTRQWVIDIHNAMPLNAWETLAVPGLYPGHTQGATASGSWITMATWPVAAAVLAIMAVHRRDV